MKGILAYTEHQARFLTLTDVWAVFIDRPLFNNGLCSLSSSCRSSPQTSTETVTPPSLMLVLASPSTTTLSSWSHGATLKPQIAFTFTCINSHRLGLIPFLSLVPNQVRQRVWIQQPRLRPDGSHGHQGVKPNWPSLLYARSHILLMPELCLCNKKFWYFRLCVQFHQIVNSPHLCLRGKVPQRTKEKYSNWWPIIYIFFFYLFNSLFCSCLDGVEVWEHFCLQCWSTAVSGEIKSSVCEIHDLLFFSLLSQQSRLCLISF